MGKVGRLGAKKRHHSAKHGMIRLHRFQNPGNGTEFQLKRFLIPSKSIKRCRQRNIKSASYPVDGNVRQPAGC